MHIALDVRLAGRLLRLEQLHRLFRQFNLSDEALTECPEMQRGASHVLRAQHSSGQQH